IVVIDVSEQLVITDCFVLASADTERQVASVVDEIEDKLREAGHKPLRREGTREGRWALLDYNDVVVHVQHVDERDYYSLDRLWKDCPVVEVDGVENTGSPASPAGEHHDDSLAPEEPQRDRELWSRGAPATHAPATRPDGLHRLLPDAGTTGHRAQRTRCPAGARRRPGTRAAAAVDDHLLGPPSGARDGARAGHRGRARGADGPATAGDASGCVAG